LMQYILKPKLLPFARQCQQDRPNTIVVEDGAPSHAHQYIEKIYMDWEIMKLFWPGNSPDLNMIEPCWAWMKRATTAFGAPQTRKDAERVWKWAWRKMSQERIQAWIERIPRHIQEVIRLEGDNNYREGREGGGEMILELTMPRIDTISICSIRLGSFVRI
jgi:transposase